MTLSVGILAVSAVVCAVVGVLHSRPAPRPGQPVMVSETRLPAPTFLLHARKPDGETVIPFTLRNGNIHVKATFDGRAVDSIIDTGSGPVLCPPGVIPDTKGTVSVSTSTDDNGVTEATRRVLVSSLRIGPFEWKDLVVDALDRPGPLPPGAEAAPPQALGPLSFAIPLDDRHVAGDKNAYALIGNDALHHVIMTIDYRAQRLILRRSEDTPPAPKRGDCELKFTWGSSGTGPLVTVVHRGAPMHFELDTGWGCAMPGVAEAWELQHDSHGRQTGRRHRIPIRTFLGASEEDCVVDFPFQIFDVRDSRSARVRVNSPAVILPGLSDDEDGVFGTFVLSHFCVTIDYAHRRIILRPYQN